MHRYRDAHAAADAPRRSRATGRHCATLEVRGHSYSPLRATSRALHLCIAIHTRKRVVASHAIATGIHRRIDGTCVRAGQ
ncbi:hypothetical protein C8F00_2720 [Xanthomonas vasicola]